jgi:hypothetical protein
LRFDREGGDRVRCALVEPAGAQRERAARIVVAGLRHAPGA